MLPQPGQETINEWRAAAPFWEKHREIIREMFAPVTKALVEDALIGRARSNCVTSNCAIQEVRCSLAYAKKQCAV
jgi:hypothetical protein